MGTIPRLVVGQKLNGISAEGWNRFRAATLAVEEAQQYGSSDLSDLTSMPSLKVDVMRSGTGSDLQTYSVVGLEKPTSEIPTDLTEPPLTQFFLDAISPDEDKAFGILSSSLDALDNSGGEATYLGYTWAQVDIVSASDTVCGVETGNYTNLVSGTGSTAIEWKPTGTGIKWCIVNLGGGTTTTVKARAMITGTVPAAVFDGASKIITPGESASAVCTVMKWDQTSGQSIADPDYSIMKGHNETSTSEVIGTVAQPVVMGGSVETRGGSDVFVLDPFDMYSLTGNDIGASVIAIPYRAVGERKFQVDSVDCSA